MLLTRSLSVSPFIEPFLERRLLFSPAQHSFIALMSPEDCDSPLSVPLGKLLGGASLVELLGERVLGSDQSEPLISLASVTGSG